MALILSVHALRRFLKLICEYDLHSLPNKKVSGAKDHGKSYTKVRPPLVRQILRNRLFVCSIIPNYSQLSKTDIFVAQITVRLMEVSVLLKVGQNGNECSIA